MNLDKTTINKKTSIFMKNTGINTSWNVQEHVQGQSKKAE